MAPDFGALDIVQAGTAKTGLAEQEAARLDDVDGHAQARTQADDCRRVLRDIGLKKGKPHG